MTLPCVGRQLGMCLSTFPFPACTSTRAFKCELCVMHFHSLHIHFEYLDTFKHYAFFRFLEPTPIEAHAWHYALSLDNFSRRLAAQNQMLIPIELAGRKCSTSASRCPASHSGCKIFRKVKALTWALEALSAGQAMYSGCAEKAELRPAWLGLKGRRLSCFGPLALDGPSASYCSMHKWHHSTDQAV